MLLSSRWSDRIRYPLMWKIAVSNRFMDLQKYPRNRKSKRKQQPEALDSKICSTFPVIAGSSFVRMQINRCYLFNFCLFLFFVPKGFNWEAGPHWTWTLWRPPVGPGPRHWHWYCPTQSYLHFESCHLMTSSSLQVEPSWRWEIPGQVQVTRFRVHCRTQTGQLSSCGLFLSRAAVRRHISHAQACRSAGLGHRREVPIQVRAVDVMAGGGGGAGPAQSIRHQEPGTRTWTEPT
jgi:hypothetical protein